MPAVHPFTLTFQDRDLEGAFLHAMVSRMRHQGRVAIIVGTIIYLALGILDVWLIWPEYAEQVWSARITALCVPAVVFVVSYTESFVRLGGVLLAAVGFAAGVGLITMQTMMPVDRSALFYPALILATFYTYNFIGTRFIYALIVDMTLLISYNSVFGALLDYPLRLMANHDFFIISANLIGGFAGYLSERQRRFLFLRERELDEERNLHLKRSLHDELTGLPNRVLLYDRVSQALIHAERDGVLNCGIFIDLDGFKPINDKLSHKVGDDVLWQVADRMKSAARSVDTVARIGGDEFFILALEVGDKDNACKITKKIIEAVSMPIRGIPDELSVSASAGVCLFPYDGVTVDDLINRADKAMYRAKRSGKGQFALVE